MRSKPSTLVALAMLTALLTLLGSSAVSAATLRERQWWLVTWRMDEVWQLSQGAGVTVAVIDSGVDATVKELSGATLPGLDLTGAGGDGRTDDDGHGTHMAALIAARGTGDDFSGVAPAAQILPVKIPPGLGYREAMVEGIRWAADSNAQVISISLASANALSAEVCPASVQDAVFYALRMDVVVVAGAGNTQGGQPNFPAACRGVISTGAFDVNLDPWERSHADEYVDAAAPGVGMVALGPGGEIGFTHGTSNATALMSGLFALVRAKFPELSARDTVTRALASARDLAAPGRDDQTGYGGFRPYQALTIDVPAEAANPIFDEVPVDATAGPTLGPVAEGSPTIRISSESGAAGGSWLDAKAGLAVGLSGVGVATLVVVIVLFARRRRHNTARK